VYLILYRPAIVPNVRSLMHGGQQIRSRETGKAATNDGNFDASRLRFRIRWVTHLLGEKVGKKFSAAPSEPALNGGKG